MSASNRRSLEVTRTFHLLQPLGAGGMGEVYEAVEPELGQRLAVKVLRLELATEREARERFAAEAEIMASIDHPGNLPIYGFGVDTKGRPFYAMKKVAGRTLEDLLVERGERATDLTWLRRLLDLFEEACDTVACTHQSGVIHRDLKPANILIDEEHGGVYVIDWGIAKRIAAPGSDPGAGATFHGAVMGSPGYLSPEQARGDSATAGPQADVFALGVILYQILTGSQPFAGDTARESVLRAVHRKPQDPRRLNFWVSRSLAAVCGKALEKDPSRRYPTARELAADVRAYREGRRVSVTRRSLPERIRGRALRRPGRAALALATATSLFILAIFVGVQVWADQHLAEKAFESIAADDDAIVDIDRRLRALDGDQAGGGPELASRRRELELRRTILQFEAISLLVHVAQLRFINTDNDVLVQGRRRMFETVESALRKQEPEIAKAFASTVLERIEADADLLDYSAADSERLRALLAEADAGLAERSAPKP